MAYLLTETGDSRDKGKIYPLSNGALIIGRYSPDSMTDISVHNDYVSRRHAEINISDNKAYICDLNSKNGTDLNGQRLIPGKYYKLSNHCHIGLGTTHNGIGLILRYYESSSTLASKDIADSLQLKVDWLKIDTQIKEVYVNDKPVLLSKKEYSVLLLLRKKAGQVCTREEIIEFAWPEVQNIEAVSNASVDQLIYRLRRKIEFDPVKPERIVSKKNFGYMLL